jgi:transcriptional regulator with XRE-family HTH domain
MMPAKRTDRRRSLAERRRDLGLSQLALALKAGVSVSTVCNMERGARVSEPTLARLALALGCKPEDIQ